MNAVLKGNENSVDTRWLEKASATVLYKGDFVTLDAGGLAIFAPDTATKLAVVAATAGAGKTLVATYAPRSTEYYVTADVNYAKAQRSKTYDLKVVGAVQTLNQAATSTNCLTVSSEAAGGTVGAKTEVVVKITNPLY